MFAGRFFGARYFGGRHFGKAGLTVPGYYTGSRYFGSRYFGPSYFGSDETNIPFEIVQTAGVSLAGVLLTSGSAVFGTDFEVTQTSGISLSGSLALAGNLTYPNEDWSITPPLELRALVGTLSIECDLEFGGGVALPSGGYWGRRFWGANYFGQRYFGTGDSFAIVQTAGVGLTGTLTAASGIAQALGIDPSTLGLTGVLGITADASFSETAEVVRRRGHATAWVKARQRIPLRTWIDYLTEEEPTENTQKVIAEVKAGRPIPDVKPPKGPENISAERLAAQIIPSRLVTARNLIVENVEVQKVVAKAIRIAQERDDEDILMLL